MHPYMVIPLLSCVASAMIGAAILARDPVRRANRLAALLVGGVSWWAGCEVLWNAAEDPAVVLRLVKLSSIGWAGLGRVPDLGHEFPRGSRIGSIELISVGIDQMDLPGSHLIGTGDRIRIRNGEQIPRCKRDERK